MDPTEGLEMPPKTKLDEATLADFEAWVTMGAPDPREGKARSRKCSGPRNKSTIPGRPSPSPCRLP